MDEIESSNGQFVTIRTTHDGQFPQTVTSTQAINMRISQPENPYQGGINFETIKQEPISNSLQLHSSAEIPIKTEMQVVTSNLLTTARAGETHKLIQGQPTFVPVSHAMNVNSSAITLSNLDTLGTSSSLGGTNVPVYHLSSFDNCDSVLRQQNQPTQSFIINSTDSILSTGSIHQSEELVYLPTSAANHSDAHFVNALPSSSTQPTRLILQSNQINPQTHQLLTSNSAPLFLHVGNNTIQAPVHNSGISINNKGHIIIKSASTKVKQEPLAPTNEGVVKILVRDTYPKTTAPTIPLQIVNNESVRQHVQINLPSKQAKVLQYDSLPSQASNTAIPQTYPKDGTTSHKLYSCPNCDIQFLKALNLRLHKRECNKPEVKPEKIPSYMCAFCKAVFKSSSQVNSHFSSCSEHPSYGGKDKPKTGKNSDIEKKLAFPILIKCQDCDRTFSKERQYASHLRRCTEVNFNDLSGSKTETAGEENGDGGAGNEEDPFADPPSLSVKRGRGNSGGRRGRPPGRSAVVARSTAKTNVLFEGANVSEVSPGLIVLDNDNIVRSTTALAHTLNLSLDTAMVQGKPQPHILVSNPNGVKAKGKIPQAWSLICSLCQKMFVAKEALACHIVDQHGSELIAAKDVLLGNTPQPHTLYRCPLCILNFQSEEKILEHLVLRHTGRLQDCYSDLQAQTGTFVCSLCSIVLLTKNLLLEHMSLQHLDELLLGSKKAKANDRRLKETNTPVIITDNEDSWDGDLNQIVPVPNSCKLPLNPSNPTECCFCLETFSDEQKLHNHYVSSHEMETDADGCIVDTGIDVDVRVKDTQNLLLIAGTKMNEGTPEKTVLIGKKPKKSFMAVCQTCHKNFNRQDIYYRHVQEGCLPTSSDGSKCLSSTEKNFFCKFKECSHLVYNQVKSLFKHMYDGHAITVPKERRTFRNLKSFNQWLEVHSRERNVKFVTENSRIEKGSVSFSQMVCEKFHSSRENQAKEKVAELSKPTKKRLSVRTARIEDCYARIHLRTAYNCNTSSYDGETQMIYYPEHSHLKEGPHQEAVKSDEIGQKRKRNGAVVGASRENSLLQLELDPDLMRVTKRPAAGPDNCLPSTSTTNYADNLMCFSAQNGNSSFDFTTAAAATSPNVIVVQSAPPTPIMQTSNAAVGSQPANVLAHHNRVMLREDTLSDNTVIVQSCDTILVHNPADTNRSDDPNQSDNRPLIGTDAPSSYIVQDANLIMNMNHQQVQPGDVQEYADEFVLPADAEEWTKLFGLLRDRLIGDDLSDEDKKEGETLLAYETIITAISVHDQASIFQRLCTITGTAVESS